MFRSVKNLLTGLIDYAGLFPPASLAMSTAVENFHRYRAGEFSWALGRFIVPASRLAELPGALPLSVLAGKNLDQDLASTHAFDRRYPGSIGSIEVRVTTVAEIHSIAKKIPSEFITYFEVPADTSPAALVTAIGEEGARAKIRTGGVKADAFPKSADLVRFLEICSTAGVAFKATAGLHHPLRCKRPLTYEASSPSTVMHGFLNLFIAASLVKHHWQVMQLIEEDSPEAFQFDEEGVRWREHKITSQEICETRRDFASGFGSCSFEEPIAELRAMRLL